MGSRRLAQTLIAGNLVGPADIESALQRQVVLGGSLDTNLLEADLIDEATLLKALGEATELPSVGRADIDAIGMHMPRLFPLVFAETYHLVPMRLVDDHLTAIVDDVPDAQLQERITQRLQLQIVPAVTSEVRLHYAMHRLYGTDILPRFTALLAKLDGTQGADSSPRPAAADETKGEHMLSWGVSSAHIAPSRGKAGAPLTGGDVRSLVARLDAAPNRDAIVDILLGFALTVFEFAGLFLVQGERVHGWRSTTAELTQKVAQISVGLGVPSVFQTIFDTHAPSLGPLPANPINDQLLASMQRSAPRAACLAPITVGGRLVAILYADNGTRGIAPKRVAALLVLLQRAGLCFEGLIRRRKGAAQKLVEAHEAEPPTSVPVASAPQAAAPSETDFSDLTESRPLPSSDGTPHSLDVPHELPVVPVSAGDTASAGDGRRDSQGLVAGFKAAKDAKADGFAGLEFDVDVSFTNEPPHDENEVDYVAFADLNETPQNALDDWEDVLVEAAGLQDTSTEERSSVKAPVGSWDDVVAATALARQIVPQVTRTLDLFGTKVDERDILFDGLEADDDEARRSAVVALLKLGNSIDATLTERFPGRIAFNPLAAGARPPAFEHCSGITELLYARGAEAAPIVLSHLDSSDPLKRFFAVYFLLSVPVPGACNGLARRLYDTEPRIRYLTVEALRRYSADQDYTRILESLCENLRVPGRDTQVTILQVLGQLREPRVVPSIIPVVNSADPEVARTANSALAVICGQAFGPDLSAWQVWWRQNYSLPRASWLLRGLAHVNVTIRRVAHNELTYLTGQTVPFDPEGSEEVRQQGMQTWQTWLQAAGAL